MKINIKTVAKLANLHLTAEEEEKFSKQLEETAVYVDELEEVETDNIEATSQVTGLENVLREDIAKPSLSQEDALKNAKDTHNGFFKVKGILQNE